MAESRAPRLVQVCESLCEQLRRGVGLTTFRIELSRQGSPLVISLRSSEPIRYDPRRAWMRPAVPAQLEFTLRESDRVVARVQIEDIERVAYPESASADCERIAAAYASQLSSLLAASEP